MWQIRFIIILLILLYMIGLVWYIIRPKVLCVVREEVNNWIIAPESNLSFIKNYLNSEDVAVIIGHRNMIENKAGKEEISDVASDTLGRRALSVKVCHKCEKINVFEGNINRICSKCGFHMAETCQAEKQEDKR